MKNSKKQEIDDFVQDVEVFANNHGSTTTFDHYSDGDCVTVVVETETSMDDLSVEVCSNEERKYLKDQLDNLAKAISRKGFIEDLLESLE